MNNHLKSDTWFFHLSCFHSLLNTIGFKSFLSHKNQNLHYVRKVIFGCFPSDTRRIICQGTGKSNAIAIAFLYSYRNVSWYSTVKWYVHKKITRYFPFSGRKWTHQHSSRFGHEPDARIFQDRGWRRGQILSGLEHSVQEVRVSVKSGPGQRLFGNSGKNANRKKQTNVLHNVYLEVSNIYFSNQLDR